MADLSPIMTMFREWEAKYAKAGDQIATSDDQSDVLLDQCREIERRMMLIPITDAVDFAAKLIVATAYGDFVLPDRGEGGLLDEAEAILANREGDSPFGLSDPSSPQVFPARPALSPR